MKIAVVGAGSVGTTLATAWHRSGQDVVVAVRDPGDDKYAGLRGNLPVAQLAAALATADVVVLAVPGSAVAALVEANAAHLDGKIVIDAANVMDGSALHQLAAVRLALPNARLFRAFNCLGWENFADPYFTDQDGHRTRADLFYCGPDTGDGAKETVEQLIAAVGLDPVRLGDLDTADVLDGVTRLWFTLALGRGRGRHLAFKVLASPAG